MMDFTANSLSCLFEAVVTFIFFETFLKKRLNVPKYSYIVGTIILGLTIYTSNVFFNFGLLNVVILMILGFLYSLLFNGNLKAKITLSIFNFLLSAITEMVVLGVMVIFFDYAAAEIIESSRLKMIGVILSKLLYFIAIKLLCLNQKKQLSKMPTGYWMLFVTVLTISLLSIFLIFYFQYTNTNEYMNVYSILTAIGILYNIFLILYLYEKMSEQSENLRKQTLLEQQVKLQMQHLDEILVSQKKIRKIRHDLVNHMTALKGYLYNNEIGKGIEYIDTILAEGDINIKAIDTGNTVIDTIVTAKRDVAASKNIKFIYNIQIPQNIKADSFDMCVLLGNALDNAIEACEKSDKDKYINLSFVCDNCSTE